MDGGAGLVAVIFTFHEPTLWGGIVVGLIAVIVYALVFRRSAAPRLLTGATILFFATVVIVMAALATFTGSRGLSVEAIRATAPPR